MTDTEFPKSALNSVQRHRERGHYDLETIQSIINVTPVAHVGFVPNPSDPEPVVLPMIARIGQFRDQPPHCYIHGYVSARMFRKASDPSNGSDDDGLPVCVTATQVVNLVLAITPFNHSYDYRSAVIHGRASLIDPAVDRDENLWAMQLMTDGIVPGRWDQSRVPPDESEIASTRILKVRIVSASAKIHDTGVKDDKKDLANLQVREKVWTGVIPYQETLGTPVPDETNLVKEVPSYITDHVRRFNEQSPHGAASSTFPESIGAAGRMAKSFFGL